MIITEIRMAMGGKNRNWRIEKDRLPTGPRL